MRWELLKGIGAGSAITAAVIGVSSAHLSWPNQSYAAEPSKTLQAAPAQQPSVIAPQTPDDTLIRLNNAFTGLAEKMSPTVVNIYTKTGLGPKRMPRGPGMPPDMNGMPDGDDFDFFFNGPRGMGQLPREAQALGSGFVINTDGYIVTNSHVVRMAGKNADEIMVKFIGEDSNKGHAAKIVGVDEATDVALLKLTEKKSDMKAAPLGDSDGSKVGEWVVAIGNPYGHTHTLTQGILSALGRSIEGARTDFIQTSASINPGNSGGPLFNLKGEVIGINTAIDPRAQGIGFAIPINTAKNVIDQLISKGRVTRAWMGVGIQDLSDEIAGYMRLQDTDGVLVKEVMKNAPAERAGIQAYDVIKKVNGKEVKTTRDLVRSIESLPAGKTADIEVLRGNQTKSLKVQVAEQPAQS